MKVLGLVGSYRKNGNTDILLKKVLDGVKSEHIDSRYIFLDDYDIKDCIGCEGCKNTYKCVINDDMQQLYPLLMEADAIVLGSPTYFYNVTGKVKNFLNRLYCYEIFDEHDRSIWMSLNEVVGVKYAVTVAVCEQDNEEDMGFTSLTMSKTLEALGYRIIANIKALNAFSKGSILQQKQQLENAAQIGVKLAKTLKLRNNIKNTYKML
ncbi:MAG: flavodoxin family protein [Firmicutes bacterium]|nr:flavodoxin family protein [Bacillota bacterium]